MNRLFEPTSPEQPNRRRRAHAAVLRAAGMACLLSTLAAVEPKSAISKFHPTRWQTRRRHRFGTCRSDFPGVISPRRRAVSVSISQPIRWRSSVLTPRVSRRPTRWMAGWPRRGPVAGTWTRSLAEVSWQEPVQASLKVHSIWQYLLDHGTAGSGRAAQGRSRPATGCPGPYRCSRTATARGVSRSVSNNCTAPGDVAAGTRRVRHAGGRAGGVRDPSGLAQGRTRAGPREARTGGDPGRMDQPMGGLRQSQRNGITSWETSWLGTQGPPHRHRRPARVALQVRRGPLGQRPAGSRVAAPVPLRSALARTVGGLASASWMACP